MHSVLAARSHFSIGESILTVERLIDAAKTVGASTIALTDTMSVTGMIDFTNRSKKAGVRPIIGCRLRLLDDEALAWRKSREDKKAPPEYSLIYYVLSEKGLTTLFRLLSLANSEGRFYHVPRLSFRDLFDALKDCSADDVAIASGDMHSVVLHRDAVLLLETISASLSASNTFITLTPVDTPYWDSVNARAIKIRESLALPFLVTSPVFYGPGDADSAEVMNAISRNVRLADPWHYKPHVRELHPRSVVDLVAQMKGAALRLKERRSCRDAGPFFAEGLRNTAKLVDLVHYEWKKAPISLPKMAEDEVATMILECKKGWMERFKAPVFGHRPTDEELLTVYKPRLTYELQVLKTLGFAGYFLLVQDVVRFAKAAGILVGPGRGSVGGSLVAYLMGITDCDPLRFGLLFERFINPERIDLPDADLDFMSERRGEVVDYLIEKYGQARVAGISNFGTLAAASAIRDVGKCFGLSETDYACSKMAPKEHGANVKLPKAVDLVPEIAKFRDSYPGVWKHMVALEGVMRNLGRHAAGVVVGGCDLEERAVIERRKDGATINWDKRIVEDQGLVKMDILGLQTLDLIALTLAYIRKRHSARVDLLRIPLDDAKVLDNFAQGFTNGIFQFDGGGMKRLLRNLGKDGVMSFDDIAACTALYRPGPMESGMMDSYWKRKAGEESIEYDHPALVETLEPTFGVMVYQEQVMQASRVIAGYSAPDADKLRKIMGKKLPEEMAKERGKFVEGCIKTVGMSEVEAGDLFDKIEGFAGYGFNKSHSVEYSLISYQSMWLKTHYPVEFFASALSLLDQKKLPAILKDAAKMGIEIRMPDINLSTGQFEILTDTQLCIPFTRIKGISENTTNAILEARKTGNFVSQDDLSKRVERRKCNIRHMELLAKVGAFASIEPGSPVARHPDRIKDQRDLIPGLITDTVPVHRSINSDKSTLARLNELFDRMREDVADDAVPVSAGRGRRMRLMVIQDCPSPSEERAGKMALGDGFGWERIKDALDAAGVSTNDVYWTSLVKRPKEGKQVSPSEIARYAPYLEQEIDLLRPPAIVLLGSATVRHFIKDFKGKASEEAGKVIYNAALDLNMIVGFNPGEIYHDEAKQTALNEVFVAAFELVD